MEEGMRKEMNKGNSSVAISLSMWEMELGGLDGKGKMKVVVV